MKALPIKGDYVMPRIHQPAWYGKVIDLSAFRTTDARRIWRVRSYTRLGWLLKARILLTWNPAFVCTRVVRRPYRIGRLTFYYYIGIWTNAPNRDFLLPSALRRRLGTPLSS